MLKSLMSLFDLGVALAVCLSVIQEY